MNKLKRLQNRREMPAADLVIEAIGEGFQIDVGRIHRTEKFGAWLRVDIIGRNGDRLDALFTTGHGNVDCVF